MYNYFTESIFGIGTYHWNLLVPLNNKKIRASSIKKCQSSLKKRLRCPIRSRFAQGIEGSDFAFVELCGLSSLDLHSGSESVVLNGERDKRQMDSLDHLESMIREINHQTCNVAKKIFTL